MKWAGDARVKDFNGRQSGDMRIVVLVSTMARRHMAADDVPAQGGLLPAVLY